MTDREPLASSDREPLASSGRLDPVTPGSQTSTDHAHHDRWIIVRAVSQDDDLTPDELTAARAWIDTCPECALLASDIATISQATATSMAPARPRDFRLTPAQVRASASFWARLSRWLATPRASLVRPLGAASLAIGILLVFVGPSLRGPVTASAPGAGRESASASPSAGAEMFMTQMQASPEPEGAGPAGQARMAQASPTDTQADTVATSPGPEADTAPGTSAKQTSEPHLAVAGAPNASPTPPVTQDMAATPAAPTSDASVALTLLGIVLAGTGVLVLVLTWLARRLAPDPLHPT